MPSTIVDGGVDFPLGRLKSYKFSPRGVLACSIYGVMAVYCPRLERLSEIMEGKPMMFRLPVIIELLVGAHFP